MRKADGRHNARLSTSWRDVISDSPRGTPCFRRRPNCQEENMTNGFLRRALATAACAAPLAFAAPSMAATVNMKADMNASNEVPVNESKGTGVVTATYDTATKKLSWIGTYAGLSGPATAAHFHAGEPGK